MSRQYKGIWTFLSLLAVTTGCHPTQPYYLFESGDLSHYLDKAMEIDTPNVETPSLSPSMYSGTPLTLENMDQVEFWDVSLQEVVNYTLQNSEYMRKLGGRVAGTSPDEIARTIINPFAQTTIYDVALSESAYGGATGAQVSNPVGVEAALSEFDARLDSSIFWAKNDRPQNFGGFPTLFTPTLDQDTATFTTGLTKTSRTGGTATARLNANYDSNNSPTRALVSDYSTNLELTVSQPLLQGSGAEYNGIAGPFSFGQYQGGFINSFDGVVIARVRTDQTLADFEGGVRDLVKNIEENYWELYFAYRDLDAKTVARDNALRSWQTVYARFLQSVQGGSGDKEAQARGQYFEFKAQVETALTQLQSAEANLRYIMGLPPSDGRVLRPTDEPSFAMISFDPQQIREEALNRRVDIRKQKWEIKERELQLVAAKNHLLPRLDATARYRYTGLGDDLLDNNRNGLGPIEEGSTAFETLTGGDFQEWQLGLQFEMPLGFRREMSAVKHHQFLVAQACTILKNLELEAMYQVEDSYRNVSFYHNLINTNFQRYVATKDEVEIDLTSYEASVGEGTVTLDLLLDAQRRHAIAESALFRSLVDYNLAIMNLQYRKGSLLEYDGVYLAEGPWPAKAYFDAMRQARKRDASKYINYGMTAPRVVSQGPHQQQQGAAIQDVSTAISTQSGPEVIEAPMPDIMDEEMLPTPLSDPTPEDPFGAATPSGQETLTGSKGPTGTDRLAASEARVVAASAHEPQTEPSTIHFQPVQPALFESADEPGAAPTQQWTSTSQLMSTSQPSTTNDNGQNDARVSTQVSTLKVADETVSHHTPAATASPAANGSRPQRRGPGPNLRR